MAYLSNVTHRSLVERHQILSSYGDYDRSYTMGAPAAQDLVSPEEAGIISTGKFFGGLRCNEVHRTPGTRYDTMTVWVGEQDGALCVRDAMGHRRFTIEKKNKVFVTALMCHGWDNTPGRFMYAGMSDGNLRVYDQVNLAQASGSDYELICVRKKHTAGITCMISVRDLIITGGRDWQIFMWKWEGTPGRDGDFACIDQFWGHQNAVRCLTYDQGPDRLLYSGGDDCSIKCLQLETGVCRTVPGGFPIEGHPITKHGHKSGIRALVVYEKYLFSASEDGTIKVWDSQDGTYVNTMFRPARNRSSNSAILSLLKDPAGGRIWAGGADGVIRVFSAYDHVQICHIDQPHHGSMVTGLTYLGRLNAIKAWYMSKDGTIRVVYSESDTSDEVCHMREEREVDMSREIEDLRTTSLDGFRLLEEKKKEQIAAVERVNRRQDLAVRRLATQREQAVKEWGWAKLMGWYRQERTRRKCRMMAEIMGRNSTKAYMAFIFNQLRTFAELGADRRRSLTVARAIASTCKTQLQVIYYQKLRAYADKHDAIQRRKQLARTMLSTTDRGLRMVYWSNLTKFLDQCRAEKKRRAMILIMAKLEEKSYFRQIYYKKWKAFLDKIHYRKRCIEVCEKIQRMRERRLREIFVRRASRVPYMAERRRFTEEVERKLRREEAELTKIVEHREHKTIMTEKENKKLNKKITDLEAKIVEVESRLGTIKLSAEEILEQTNEEEAACAELNQDIADLEAQIRAQEEENHGIEERIRKFGRTYFEPDASNKHHPKSASAVLLVKHLKARGISCRLDRKQLETYSDGSAFKGLLAPAKKRRRSASPAKRRGSQSPARRGSSPPNTGRRGSSPPAKRGKSPAGTKKGAKNKDGEKLERVFVAGVNLFREALCTACDANDDKYDVSQDQWDLPMDVVLDMTPQVFKKAVAAMQMIIYGIDRVTVDDASMASAYKNMEKAPQTAQVLQNQEFLFDVVSRLHLERKMREYIVLGKKYCEDNNMMDDWIGKMQVKDIAWNVRSGSPGSQQSTPRKMMTDPDGPVTPLKGGEGNNTSFAEDTAQSPASEPADSPKGTRFVRKPDESGEFFCADGETEARQPRPSGLKVGTDLAVSVVKKGSPAQAAGMKVGDVVTHVNGKAIKTKPGYITQMKKAAPGMQVEVTIKRGLTRVKTVVINLS